MPDRLTLEQALTAVHDVDAWLDRDVAEPYQEQPLAHTWVRLTKVCEEAGEVWRALSALTGENPRKGVCGTEDDLLGELADTASAAICAIQHRTKDAERTWQVLSAALAKAHQRAMVAAERCPRCESPAPNLHPAMQHEGEVQSCPHPWHSEAVNA